ncbi:MAG: hypothetical protein PVH17_05205 [Anaerolineae bacterium]|jgi:hypothetical protein
MKRSRFFALALVTSLLLAALVVGAGLAQVPSGDSEPSVPLYQVDAADTVETEGSGSSSQPIAPDYSADPAIVAPEPSEAQLSTSAPILPDGSVAARAAMPTVVEELPQGIDATTAIADFRVSGTALRPRSDDVSYIPTAGGGCFYPSSGNSFRVFNTGLYLPQGSNVLVMRMYYDDTSSSNSRAWFSVYDLYGDLVDEWSVDSVGDTGNGFNDTGLISHTINYLSYSYAINWRPSDLGSDMQLCGFRIFYEPPYSFSAFLPSTQKNYSAP